MSEAQHTRRPVSLTWLLDGIAPAAAQAGDSVQVADLTQDSRAVRVGSVFFALRGRQNHGLEFATQARAQGASAILWEPGDGVEPPHLPHEVFAAPVPELSALLGRIADRFFDSPSSRLRVCGFTGTNGKTTCAYLLAQSLERMGTPAAYIGTLGWGRIGALRPLAHTTPDAISVHRMLADLRDAGIRDVAMEVSSHALDQHRVAGVRFHTAAFTNLTHDHLDYHETMAAYGAAKARLFDVPELRQLVINVADDFGRGLGERLRDDARLTAVWTEAPADAETVPGASAEASAWSQVRHLRAARIHCEAHGLAVELDGSFGRLRLHARLIGRFNAENSVVVLGCLLSLGVPPARAVAALGACTAPPGRMEVIESIFLNKPMAVVDYAHTPDALAKALRALREHCIGALWCVFGCGGDRDPAKRPIMGAIADELADQIIVTDDNPRSEDPTAITRAIAAGIERHEARVIGDRAQAIAAALTEARAADVVLIAGKGHEDYQIYGGTRRAFSDRREALRHLREAA